jgi:hypothetical protein
MVSAHVSLCYHVEESGRESFYFLVEESGRVDLCPNPCYPVKVGSVVPMSNGRPSAVRVHSVGPVLEMVSYFVTAVDLSGIRFVALSSVRRLLSLRAWS